MSIDKYLLAWVCNNPDNINDYTVINELCYYKDEYIGRMNSKFDSKNNTLDIYFLPKKPIQYINVSFIVTPTGIEFKE